MTALVWKLSSSTSRNSGGIGSLYASCMSCVPKAIVELSRGALVGHERTVDVKVQIADNDAISAISSSPQ